MAMIKKKAMGKPMKKAEFGTQTPATKKKKPAKTYPIISESGDLADALNEYEAMKKKGTVPKTDAEAKKYMDNLAKQGKLGPKKMGGTVKKAANGASLKPVPAGKKGLAKLPTPVRNKMGFQKNGGKVKK